MELAIFVYLIGVLGKLTVALGILLSAAAIALLILGIWYSTLVGEENCSWHVNRDGSSTTSYLNKRATVRRGLKWVLIALIVIGPIQIITPSTKTAWTMAGAYAAQQIAQDPRSGEIGNKVFTIINQQLDQVIERGRKELQPESAPQSRN
jgi:hypothetical protein